MNCKRSSKMMSKEERSVLKKFQTQLSNDVFMSDEFIRELSLTGVINAKHSTLAQKSKTNEEKMSVVIQSILEENSPQSLSRLCSALERTGNVDARSLGRSLRANLRIEKGEIEPRRHVVDQAAVYVHKKFGHSKKFSQGDKTDIIRAMAVKLEADSAECHRDAAQTETQLTAEKAALCQRDGLLAAVTESLLRFHRTEESRLTTHAHGKDSTSVFIWNMAQLDAKTLAGLDLLHRHFEEFLTRVDVAVYVAETLQRERERSLKLLGVTGCYDDAGGDKRGAGLEGAVERRAKEAPVEQPEEGKTQDDVIKELTSRVAALESSVAKQRMQAEGVRLSMEKADRTIAELRKMEKPVEKVSSAKPYHRAMWA